jgi:hypothetical protein
VVAGKCQVSFAPATKTCSLPNRAVGFCSGNGTCVSCSLSSQCKLPPSLDRQCNSAVCNVTTSRCSVLQAGNGRSCSIPGISNPATACSNGNCVECSAARHCSQPPVGFNLPCTLISCTSGRCNYTKAPPGSSCKAGPSQLPGKCSQAANTCVRCLMAGRGCTRSSQCCNGLTCKAGSPRRCG